MNTNKEEIHVVWFKRDMRLQDNEAIYNALESNKRVLFLYVFENSLLEDPHYDKRHWDFIKQSIADLNTDLKKYNTKVLCVQTEVVNTFNQLFNYYKINSVFSHQETGLLITYNRDKEFTRYCRNNSVNWVENNNNGVLRGLLNREDWFDKWDDFMYDSLIKNEYNAAKFISIEEITQLEKYFQIVDLKTPKHKYFQNFKKEGQEQLGDMQIHFLINAMKNTCLISLNQHWPERVVADYLLILPGEIFQYAKYLMKL